VNKKTFTQSAIQGIVRDQFATKAAAGQALGFDRAHMSRLSSGAIVPNASTIAKICRKLDRHAAHQLIDAFLADELRRLADELELVWENKGNTGLGYRLRR
jgi:predicted transcriptional regulator